MLPLRYCCCAAAAAAAATAASAGAAAAAAARIFFFYCRYAVPGTFLLISTTSVQTVVRFLLCWMLASWTSGHLSVPGMRLGPAWVHTKVGRRASCDAHSLLLPLAAAASNSCRW